VTEACACPPMWPLEHVGKHHPRCRKMRSLSAGQPRTNTAPTIGARYWVTGDNRHGTVRALANEVGPANTRIALVEFDVGGKKWVGLADLFKPKD
jgi:hypothetical protein